MQDVLHAFPVGVEIVRLDRLSAYVMFKEVEDDLKCLFGGFGTASVIQFNMLLEKNERKKIAPDLGVGLKADGECNEIHTKE